MKAFDWALFVIKEWYMADKSKPGLWANIHAKRERGEAPAKPGDKDYPDAKNWKKVTSISEKKGTAAWQKAEGKNPEGGLNEKGRASLKAQGHDIKRPQPEGGARKDSFCARMKGMKAKLTSKETANDPDSRINKSLRKWKCGSADISKEANSMSNSQIVLRAFNKQANIGQHIADLGSKALNYYKGLDPTAQASILGAGVGGLTGGVGNVLFGDRNKGFLSRLAKGSLLGSALGAAGGAGINEAVIRGRMRSNPELASRASAIMSHKNLPVDYISDPLTGVLDRYFSNLKLKSLPSQVDKLNPGSAMA